MSILYDDLPIIHGTGEILSDNKTNWVKTKLRTEAVAQSLDVHESTAMLGRHVRMMDCGASLTFAVSTTGDKRLTAASFCRDRMCPGCQKRRSLVIFHQVKNICNSIQEDNPTFKYLLLTLTVPNVKADKLDSEIKHLSKSWYNLTRRKAFNKGVKGWFRALEVTYNGERDDFHPHLHVLLCVPSGYFKKHYISQAKWLDMWRQSTKYPHITQVDVRTIKPNPNRPESDSISAAAAEVGKYATKPSNYVAELPSGCFIAVDHVVRDLAKAIAGKRLIAFGGIMKDYHSELRLADAESNEIDLVHVDGENASIDAVMRQVYRWNVGLRQYTN